MPASLPFYAPTPIHSARVQFNAGTATEQIVSFNSVYNQYQKAVDDGAGLGNLTPDQVARVYSAARDGIINVGGNPVDYEFFHKLFGGQTKELETEATDVWVENNSNINFNIRAATDAVGSGPGGYVDFTVSASDYGPGGTTANVSKGIRLYNHQDMKILIVDSVTIIAPYNIVVRAFATDNYYTPMIYANMSMTLIQMNTTHGFSEFENESVQWETPGYLKLVQPYQLRKNYSMPYNLMMAQQMIQRFNIWIDPITGQTFDSYEFKETITQREMFQMAKNSMLWFGQRDSNQAILASYGVQTYYNSQYGGFDGFVPSIMYGGGNVRPFNNNNGWSYETDGKAITLELDAKKLAKEYLILCGLRFDMGTQEAAQIPWQDTSGSLNMKTFDRMGGDLEAIKRLGITSWSAYGQTYHRKIVSSFTDSRYSGLGYYPNMGIMLPGYGLTDSNGKEVAPVEFFRPKGAPMSGTYKEFIVDGMTTESMKTEYRGTIMEDVQMNVNAVENMFLLLPQYPLLG